MGDYKQHTMNKIQLYAKIYFNYITELTTISVPSEHLSASEVSYLILT